MNMQINRERLARIFTELCLIESPSRQEARVSSCLQEYFTRLGADFIHVDDSAAATGSQTGNLLIRFDGDSRHGEPLFFACHMDTVGPTGGIEVVREGDTFSSKNETVLGADDKSGIAALIELFCLIQENDTPHCPIELLFTTCEEIGLLGAKALDPELLQAPYGYALDSTHKNTIITGAPAANRLKITIQGKAAHSGFAPETGINALALASKTINRLTLGRIDSLSTANLGLIRGGTATNIVPESIEIEGEVRSHSEELLAQHTRGIEKIFQECIAAAPSRPDMARPSLIFDVKEDFPALSLDEDEPVIKRIHAAATVIGRRLSCAIAGGGSDANIFCGLGLKTAIIPTGMTNVHTTEEYVHLDDMVQLTELLHAMTTS
jgi:tripeptide aminopeptidase